MIRFLCHHTDNQGKGVDQIAEMFQGMRNLYTDFPEIEASISTSPQYQLFDHLNHKKSCDVIIDQITQGFLGMTSWESMLHGAAVIAGIDERTMRTYAKLWGEVPPILNARSVSDVADYVNQLARSRSMVNDVGQKGRAWMAKHYNAHFMTQLYEDYFDEVIDQWRRPIG